MGRGARWLGGLLGVALLGLVIWVGIQLWSEPEAVALDPCLSFDYGPQMGEYDWVQAIHVQSPKLRSEVEGDTEVVFSAPGMDVAKAMVWQQPTPENPDPWGDDALLTPQGVALDKEGAGAFLFPADRFPHGPNTVRIYACNRTNGHKDLYELQLFNRGGVRFRQGVPKERPPAAQGLPLLFQDDFTGRLSISGDGAGARYCAHRPTFGDFSGWPFKSPMADGEPFEQVETWLRIKARKDEKTPEGRTGLIASVGMDKEGIWVRPPAYLEARFIAQSAPGTWPAFWTLTHLDEGDAIE